MLTSSTKEAGCSCIILVFLMVSIYLYIIQCVELKFYENALRTMIRIEDTYFNMAATGSDNCLVVCDCGTMDIIASTYIYIFLNYNVSIYYYHCSIECLHINQTRMSITFLFKINCNLERLLYRYRYIV